MAKSLYDKAPKKGKPVATITKVYKTVSKSGDTTRVSEPFMSTSGKKLGTLTKVMVPKTVIKKK